jgi:c-di-GMP-binding flagellar brake protein YcgR
MYPKVNQNITIKLKSQDQSWKSIVAEVGKEDILIGFPMDRTIFGLLQNGTTIEVTYTLGENKYKFSTEIIGREIENILLFKLKKPQENEIIKIQQRENFRVKANLRLILKEKESNTINISAGGLLCSCGLDLPLKQGEVVPGTIFIPSIANDEIASIPFQGEIIRVELVKELERKKVALKMIKLEQQDQKKIIQYCFEKQRQMRLKERELKLFRR